MQRYFNYQFRFAFDLGNCWAPLSHVSHAVRSKVVHSSSHLKLSIFPFLSHTSISPLLSLHPPALSLSSFTHCPSHLFYLLPFLSHLHILSFSDRSLHFLSFTLFLPPISYDSHCSLLISLFFYSFSLSPISSVSLSLSLCSFPISLFLYSFSPSHLFRRSLLIPYSSLPLLFLSPPASFFSSSVSTSPFFFVLLPSLSPSLFLYYLRFDNKLSHQVIKS